MSAVATQGAQKASNSLSPSNSDQKKDMELSLCIDCKEFIGKPRCFTCTKQQDWLTQHKVETESQVLACLYSLPLEELMTVTLPRYIPKMIQEKSSVLFANWMEAAIYTTASDQTMSYLRGICSAPPHLNTLKKVQSCLLGEGGDQGPRWIVPGRLAGPLIRELIQCHKLDSDAQYQAIHVIAPLVPDPWNIRCGQETGAQALGVLACYYQGLGAYTNKAPKSLPSLFELWQTNGLKSGKTF